MNRGIFMRKKFFVIFISAVIFSACGTGNRSAFNETENEMQIPSSAPEELLQTSPQATTEENSQAETLFETWQALLGADFVRSRMAGDSLRAYTRLVYGDMAYELFSTNHRHMLVDEVHNVQDYETWVFVSRFENGEYRLADYFEVPVGGWGPVIGSEIILADIDFDGELDILIFAERQFGWFPTPVYYAFLYRNGRYVNANFDGIPEPHLDAQNQRILGIVQIECSAMGYSVYLFENDELVETDHFARFFCGDGEWEVCRGVVEVVYVIAMRNGVEVNEIYREHDDADLIQELFYSEESVFGINSDRWQSIFDPHRN
jgi:hypothetical protein